jgi:hypothetical protein
MKEGALITIANNYEKEKKEQQSPKRGESSKR